MAPIVAVVGCGTYSVARFIRDVGGLISFSQASYENVEVIGLLSLLLMLSTVPLTRLVIGRRPFTHLPFDARLWECVVFGVSFITLAVSSSLVFIGALVVLPLLVPIKVILTYVLGDNANLATALVSIPIVFSCVGLAFSVCHVLCLQTGRGNLVSDIGSLLPEPRSGIRVGEVLYYSLATMLGAESPGYEPRGLCRWVTLLQLTVAKIIEILIVGVGIAVIVTKAVQ